MSSPIDNNMQPISGPAPISGDYTSPEMLQKLMFEFSTLSKSDQEKFIALFLAQFPQLQMPQINLENGDVDKIIALNESKTLSDITDAWLNSLEKIKQDKDERERSPSYQNWLQTIEPSFRIIQTEKDNYQSTLVQGVGQWMKEMVQTNKADPGAVSFMMSAVVVSTGLMGDIANVAQNPSTRQVGANPLVNDSSFFLEQLPPNLIDIASLTINFFAVPQYYLAKGGVEALGGSDKPQNDLQTAQKFANDIIDKVNKNEVGQLLNALITTRTEGGEKISPQVYANLLAKAKVAMLAMALGAIYAAQMKWITGAEFKQLLDPNVKLEKDFQLQKEATQIAQMINEQLSELSGSEQAELLTALNNYFDGNPNMKSIFANANSPTIINNAMNGQSIPG